MIPPRVILAPVDFSDPSRTALRFAARLARHTGATLHVLHAEDPLLAEGARQAGVDLARETRAELGRFLADAAVPSDMAPAVHVATGLPVDVIVQTAQRLDADVVIVGSHGMSGAERLVFGSTTEGLLRRAPVSVMVTPAQWEPVRSTAPDLSGTGPVIAAVDFSPAALEAAKAGCRLATALSTTLEIVHVIPQHPVLVRWRTHADALVRDRIETARRELDALTQSIGCGVPAQIVVTTGAVANQLADRTATDTRRPMLVLGRRTPGEQGGAPGSTAYRVLMLSKAPVLMYVAGAGNSR